MFGSRIFCQHYGRKFCRNFVKITVKCKVEKASFSPGLFRPEYYGRNEKNSAVMKKKYSQKYSDRNEKNTSIDPSLGSMTGNKF
jgi:hypothetical protein